MLCATKACQGQIRVGVNVSCGPVGLLYRPVNVLNHTSLAAALLSAGEGVSSGAPLSAVARVCCQEESL